MLMTVIRNLERCSPLILVEHVIAY